MKLHINVTKNDIDLALQSARSQEGMRSRTCPVARAANRALEEQSIKPRLLGVGYDIVWYDEHGRPHSCSLPEAASKFISEFDFHVGDNHYHPAENFVEPFEFDTECPL